MATPCWAGGSVAGAGPGGTWSRGATWRRRVNAASGGRGCSDFAGRGVFEGEDIALGSGSVGKGYGRVPAAFGSDRMMWEVVDDWGPGLKRRPEKNDPASETGWGRVARALFPVAEFRVGLPVPGTIVVNLRSSGKGQRMETTRSKRTATERRIGKAVFTEDNQREAH